MQNAFDPAEVALFSKVVDEACLKLGCDDAERATIAARVLSFAAKGMRDYETLLAVAAFQGDPLPAHIDKAKKAFEAAAKEAKLWVPYRGP